MKKLLAVLFLTISLALPTVSMASTITGGDATSQADADDILDIIFLIDTSGSMHDDINAIGTVAQSTIQNLECPECDVWVRATFAGINGTYGSVFNEGFYGLVGDDHVNSSEDNGGAALDAINSASGSWWVDDSTVDQDYYRAVVTIGDEGTENGSPVTAADYAIAYQANQAAISSGVFLFSWVTNDPWTTAVLPLFTAMAEGGTTLGGYTYGATGGTVVDDTAGTGDVAETLENIICTAGSGGVVVPEPGTIALFGIGLMGFAGLSRRKENS